MLLLNQLNNNAFVLLMNHVLKLTSRYDYLVEVVGYVLAVIDKTEVLDSRVDSC